MKRQKRTTLQPIENEKKFDLAANLRSFTFKMNFVSFPKYTIKLNFLL